MPDTFGLDVTFKRILLIDISKYLLLNQPRANRDPQMMNSGAIFLTRFNFDLNMDM